MKKIKVGPYDYSIVHGPHPTGDEGTCSPERLEIMIAPHLADQRKTNTILHESLHGVWDMFGLGNSAEEEEVVHAFATGFMMLLRDNPNLRSLLLKQMKGGK